MIKRSGTTTHPPTESPLRLLRLRTLTLYTPPDAFECVVALFAIRESHRSDMHRTYKVIFLGSMIQEVFLLHRRSHLQLNFILGIPISPTVINNFHPCVTIFDQIDRKATREQDTTQETARARHPSSIPKNTRTTLIG